MSLIWKRSSKYNCDLVFELFRDICRHSSSILLHLSKEYILFFLIKWWLYTERASEMRLLLLSKILGLHLSTEPKNNVACYSVWIAF